jgi:integrase/recombinase XerC
MRPPIVPEQPVPIFPADSPRRLLAACAGRGFEARRDTAIIMLLLVLGKGRRERALPFGHKAGEALEHYLRVRARHKHADLPWLWIGLKGRLTAHGLAMMLRRRGRQAGLPGLHPHQFRHTFAHQWLAEGGGWARPSAPAKTACALPSRVAASPVTRPVSRTWGSPRCCMRATSWTSPWST